MVVLDDQVKTSGRMHRNLYCVSIQRAKLSNAVRALPGTSGWVS
jgi:hypothetical protein